MAVVPLTADQQQAIDALVAAQDFPKVPADETQARRFGEQVSVSPVRGVVQESMCEPGPARGAGMSEEHA